MSAAAAKMLADNGLDITRVPRWLNDPSNWRGQNGLLIHIREHLVYTGIAVVIAAIIAIPLGLLIGHTGKGVVIVVGLANALRAVPAFGLLLLGPAPSIGAYGELALLLALADAGIALVGTLVGAIAVQTRTRDLIVPLMALPLLIPVVIAAAKGTTPLVLAAGSRGLEVRWLLVLGLYDLVFGLLAYALFDYLIED